MHRHPEARANRSGLRPDDRLREPRRATAPISGIPRDRQFRCTSRQQPTWVAVHPSQPPRYQNAPLPVELTGDIVMQSTPLPASAEPMPIVHSLPYHFVDYLTDPGLRTVAGRVPLKQYLSLSKGNAQIDALMAQMRANKITDTDTNKTADQTVGSTEMNLIWKGQGHPDAFVKFMNFLWDNQEQLEGVRGTLAQVYEKYFKTNTGQNPLGRMVKDHYFGIDCIGFVANYLRYVGL